MEQAKHRIVVLAIPQDGKISVGNIIPGPGQEGGRAFHLTQHPAEESLNVLHEIGFPKSYLDAVRIYECELTIIRELPSLGLKQNWRE